MLRTSSYTIFVKLQDQDEDVLLVHGYTGAYDRVSSGVAAFLRSREPKRAAKPLYGDWSHEAEPPASVAVSDATIDQLREQGYLTELSVEEEETFFSALTVKLHERALRQAPSFIFMPTYDCNLRCSYCYQDHMRTDCSFKHLLQSMRKPVVDRIFSAMPVIETLHGLIPQAGRRRNIGFFGGEPLLAANREIVGHILGRAFELGEADFWAVTNGTEIDAYRDLLGPAGIAHLQITLDGPQQEHDKRRIYGDGSGSYERIARNITMALELGVAVSVRLNVDRTNLGILPAMADKIVARGWDQCSGFGAYTSPVRAGNGKTDAGTTLSSWELDRDLTRMREDHPTLSVLARPDEGMRAKVGRIFADSREIVPSLRPKLLQRPRPHVHLRPLRRHLCLLGADGRLQGPHRPRDARGRGRAARGSNPALAQPHGGQQSRLPALPLRPALRRRLRHPGPESKWSLQLQLLRWFREPLSRQHRRGLPGARLRSRPGASAGAGLRSVNLDLLSGEER